MRCELSRAWGVSPTLARFAQSPRCRQTLLGISWTTICGIWVGDERSWTREYLQCRTSTAHEKLTAISCLPHRCEVETSCAAAHVRFCNSKCRWKAEVTLGLGRQQSGAFSTPAQAQPHRANLRLSRVSLSSLAKHGSTKSRISRLAANNDSKEFWNVSVGAVRPVAIDYDLRLSHLQHFCLGVTCFAPLVLSAA